MISVLCSAIAAALAMIGLWAASYLPTTYGGMNLEPEDFYLDMFWTTACFVCAAIGILVGFSFLRKAEKYSN
jgi:hypothetical protein